MKLLFDATELSYCNEISGHKAGVYYVAKNLLNEFKKCGIEITFICDFKRYYFMKEIMDNFGGIKLLEEQSIINKTISRILYLSKNLPLKIQYGFLILTRFYDKYLYRINKENLEQLNNFDVYFSPYTPPCKEIEVSKLKKFRMLHDTIPIAESGMPKSPKDWYYKIYNSINENDYYVTNSESTRKDVLKYFPFIDNSHIKTTLLGANRFFSPSSEESPINGKYIFSLCTLGKRKNLKFAIENFFSFIEKNSIKDLKLVLGGSIWNKYKKEFDAVVNKYDYSKIVPTGYIEEHKLAKYYSNALCFIYPSLYEGFGLPVLEAMQCGCPVITSNISSLPEVVGDAGIQINPKNNEELIKAYEKMYFDSEFRDNCKKKGLERAKLFSWEKCAKEILNFIDNTLN